MVTVILPPVACRGCSSVASFAGFTRSPDTTTRLRRRLRLVTETHPLPTKLAGAETKLEIDQKISRRWPTSKRAALRLPNHMSSQGFRGAWLKFWAPTWLTQAQEVLGVGRSVRRVQQRRYRQIPVRHRPLELVVSETSGSLRLFQVCSSQTVE